MLKGSFRENIFVAALYGEGRRGCGPQGTGVCGLKPFQAGALVQ